MSDQATLQTVASAVQDLAGAVEDVDRRILDERQVERIAAEVSSRFAAPSNGLGAEEAGGDAPSSQHRLGAVVLGALGVSVHGGLTQPEMQAVSGVTGASGGYLEPEFTGRIIDMLRPKAKVMMAGARVIEMPEGTVHLPILDDGVIGAWRAEGSAVSEEDPSWRRLTLRARTCAVKVKISQELIEDAGSEAMGAIQRDISEALALRIDYAALRGAGTDHEPLGLRNTSGVSVTALGANGATPTDFDWISDAMEVVESANAAPDGLIWSPRTANTHRKLKDSESNPLQMPAQIAELPKHVTTQIPNTLTEGSSDETSEAYVGQWDQLVVGARNGLGVRVLVSPHEHADTLETSIVAWIRADIGVIHSDAFAITSGILAQKGATDAKHS